MSFNPDLNVLKQNLEHWFKFDNLSFEQGIAMLVGVEPVDESIKALNNWYSDDALEFIKSGIQLLNGDVIGGQENRDFKIRHSDVIRNEDYDYLKFIIHVEQNRFRPFVYQYGQLLQYWNSGSHHATTSPTQFVDWSLSKNFRPKWLDSAIELGLCQATYGKTTIDDLMDKPLSGNERNTLLTIIAALCNYSDIKLEAHGVATDIATMTHDIGAPVSDDAIRSALKKIPDALQRRMK